MLFFRTKLIKLITDGCNIYVPLVIIKTKQPPTKIGVIQKLAKSG